MAIITKLSRDDFKKILSSYNIGTYKVHKHISWALQNTLYILETTKGKYVLKIFENSKSDFIEFQTGIINYLMNKKIPVARISKSRDGKELFIYKRKKIIIQKFLEGKHPKKFSNNLLKDIANKMALMNKSLFKSSFKGRHGWKADHQFKPNPGMNVIDGINFKNEEKSLLKQMESLNCKKIRKSVIHGDFHSINILVKNDSLKAILDWDDSHEDYLAYEIAVFIMDSFVYPRGIEKNKIKLFLKEYQKNLKLNKEEKKAMYYFIMQRFLGVIFWHKKQIKLHSDLRYRLQRQVQILIKDYFIFKKLSLGEFLRLV